MVSTDGSRSSIRPVQPQEFSKSQGTTVVEVELTESVTIRDKSITETCSCCCPATFKKDSRRSHVCYCPLYNVKQETTPSVAASEECDCGNRMKCCVQPFINRVTTYSLCSSDSKSPPRSPID